MCAGCFPGKASFSLSPPPVWSQDPSSESSVLLKLSGGRRWSQGSNPGRLSPGLTFQAEDGTGRRAGLTKEPPETARGPEALGVDRGRQCNGGGPRPAMVQGLGRQADARQKGAVRSVAKWGFLPCLPDWG